MKRIMAISDYQTMLPTEDNPVILFGHRTFDHFPRLVIRYSKSFIRNPE
jgi:hypothetical protein